MGETMLVTQALDERDLLVKKITDKIEKASFVAWIPMMDEYSCAVTPQVRQTGNRLSGPAGTAYASLLT
mgnify:CR=1 FL=1